MTLSGKKRLARGEAKGIIFTWCDNFVRDNGTRPTYTQAQQGSGVAAMTFSKPWAEWNASYEAGLPATLPPIAGPLARIEVPNVIIDAWSSAVATLEAAKLKELEEEKLLVRRELDKSRVDHAALATEMEAILEDGEAVHEEFEGERAEAAAALASANATISERDAAIAAIQAELVQAQKALAVLEAELKIANDMTGKLEQSLDQALADERSAHQTTKKTLVDLAEAQIVNTRLGEELTITKSALASAEAALIAKNERMDSLQEKLDATRQELSQRVADVAGASATITELRDQLTATESRSEQARQRVEAELGMGRERIVELERQLAVLRPSVQI